MPIWIISLDWPNPLVECVGRHFGMLYPNNVSNHMIWMICFSIIFGKIKRGKFQELTQEASYFTLDGTWLCMESRLFSAVLEMAMGVWHGDEDRLGLDLGDGS